MTFLVIVVYHLEYQKWRFREETDDEIRIRPGSMRYFTAHCYSSAVLPL